MSPLIAGSDFIVFSDDWGRHPFSCQHIMSRFLPGNRLLWVNTIGMRNPRLTLYDIGRSLEKIHSWFFPAEKPTSAGLPNLTIINPVMTPYNTIALLRERNRRTVVRAVRAAMTETGIHKPIVLTTLPNAADYVGAFNEAAVIYYCVDDFTKWPGVDEKLIVEMEEELLVKADLVFASAGELCSKKTRGKRKPRLLPHGVDFDHFASALPGIAGPLSHLSRPVVGFFGALSPWIDFDLLLKLARLRPEWSLVLVGPADVDVSRLAEVPNINLVGKIPYRDLPLYAASFDIALIPFLINDMTVSVNPLKLMEYLACGLPVVSTRLPEVVRYEKLVSIADTAEEFVAEIDRLLMEECPRVKEARRSIARNHSWDAVAQILSDETAMFLEGGSIHD